MAKAKVVDPVTLGILAATLVAVLFVLIQGGVLGSSHNIIILETDPLVEAIKADPEDVDLLAMQKQIELKAAALAEEGYIVLRSEMVRDAPKELYVQVTQ